jgi:hypothetical protein
MFLSFLLGSDLVAAGSVLDEIDSSDESCAHQALSSGGVLASPLVGG